MPAKLTTDEIYARFPDLEPGQEYVNSGAKMWFLCPKDHRFHMSTNSRKNGGGCPFCCGYNLTIRQPNPIAYVPAVLRGVTPNPLFLYGFTDPALLQARIAIAASI